jgi:hypothetical protein
MGYVPRKKIFSNYLGQHFFCLFEDGVIALSMREHFSGLDFAVKRAFQQRSGDLPAQYTGNVTVGLRINLHLLQQRLPSLEHTAWARWPEQTVKTIL